MSESVPQNPASVSEPLAKIAEQWAAVRLAHEAVMLEDAQEVLRQSRKTVAGLPGQLGLPDVPTEPEGMGVHIGDVINYVTPTEKTTERSVVSSTVEKPSSVVADVAAAVVPSAVAKPASILPSLLKIGLGALLAGTGVGLPFALPPIISGIGGLFSRDTPPPQVSAEIPADLGKPTTGVPDGPPAILINGQEYELTLEPDTE